MYIQELLLKPDMVSDLIAMILALSNPLPLPPPTSAKPATCK